MKPLLPPILLGLFASPLLSQTLTSSAIYDEQEIQTNAVDFSMPYSGNTTWTTGIGQTLGAAQILDAATFKAAVEAAAINHRGAVVNFDSGSLANDQSFTATFAGGAKSLRFTNHPNNAGSYSLGTDLANRTPISGNRYLARSGGPHFDFNLGETTGFGPQEKVTAIGVTLLGRNGTGGTSNWRVIAYYTNGTASGSSSTFRTLNTNTGNATQDSFAGIAAPEGYWITRMRIHSDNGLFTSIDDIAFITSDLDERPPLAPSILTDLPAEREAALGASVPLSVGLDPLTSPAPAWQWEFDAAPEDGIFETIPTAEGGTSAILNFTAQPPREGSYRVTATNSEGTATSGVCRFRITRQAPTITTNLLPLYEPIAGSQLTLSVTIAPTAYPLPTYQWFFEDVPIPAAQGGTQPSYTFTAGPATDGLYYVDVINTEGTAFSAAATVAHLADRDGDGLPDVHETNTGIFVSATDTGSNPDLADTDGDGLRDGDEVLIHGTDPNRADTDGDGLSDFQEIKTHGTNPLLADSDGDGIADGAEITAGSNPLWYQDGLEWRPGGVAGGNGTWDDLTAHWFDGEVPPGTSTVWNPLKTALFPQPAGAVSLSGTREANRLLFRHTSGTYALNAAAPGASLAFTGTDPLVRIEQETHFNLPVSGGFTLEAGTRTLRLTTDNSASLAGATVRVASGQLRGNNGAIGNGNELGAPDTTLIVGNGSQIRFFNVNEGARSYPQTLRIAGSGLGSNPGVLNNDSNAANNIQWTGDIVLDANATIATQNAATWTLANIHDAGSADKTLTLLLQNNSSTLTGALSLGGLVKTGNGTLNLTPAASAAPGLLTHSGGIIRLNAPDQLAPATSVSLANAAQLDLNGHPQTFASLRGAGTVGGLATLTLQTAIDPGPPAGAQITRTGDLALPGATWTARIDGSAASRILVSGSLDLQNTTLDIQAGELTADSYILASYGSLSGSPTVTNLPAGFQLDLQHNSGTQIALLRQAPAAGFDEWALANNLTGGPAGDDDGDGLSNLLEYALLTNPAGPDGSPGSLADGILTFTKRPEAVANGDVIYALETSPSLLEGSWTTVTPDFDTATTLSYTLPTGQGRIFARLKISRIP